jgi:3D (Asp-Asp-Asp) domain-containing protein
VRLFTGILIGALMGCRPSGIRVDTETIPSDTVRGTLMIEGSEPVTIPVLHTATGRVVILGDTDGMHKLSRLDVWMSGTRVSATRFRVEDVRVRSADGVQAWNGVLRSAPSGFRLELDDGSFREIRGAPSSFAHLAGTRVWITERPDGSVLSYGII